MNILPLFPCILINYNIAHPIDGIWNLVLACVSCNRGVGGKFDQLPQLRFLERLHTRNEFLIDSQHPIAQTLKQQTGNSEPKRRSFLTGNYNAAKTGRLINSNWQPAFEYPPAFWLMVQLMANNIQRIKLYFNAEKICLGGVDDDWWLKDFDGDYWASDYFWLPIGYNPIGKPGNELLQFIKPPA